MWEQRRIQNWNSFQHRDSQAIYPVNYIEQRQQFNWNYYSDQRKKVSPLIVLRSERGHIPGIGVSFLGKEEYCPRTLKSQGLPSLGMGNLASPFNNHCEWQKNRTLPASPMLSEKTRIYEITWFLERFTHCFKADQPRSQKPIYMIKIQLSALWLI